MSHYLVESRADTLRVPKLQIFLSLNPLKERRETHAHKQEIYSTLMATVPALLNPSFLPANPPKRTTSLSLTKPFITLPPPPPSASSLYRLRRRRVAHSPVAASVKVLLCSTTTICLTICLCYIFHNYFFFPPV